jgi:hypothetical protein
MQRFAKIVLVFCLCVMVSSVSYSLAQAAPAKMTIKVQVVEQTKTFWDYAYLTREGFLSKATSVQIGWDTGMISKELKYATVMTPGKFEGEVNVTTEKGELVNYRVSVRDAKNVELGSISMQVRNIGQTEFYYISLPDFTEPKINYSNSTPDEYGQRTH